MTRGSSRWSEFRRRGGLWVVAQSILFAATAATAVVGPRWPDDAQLPLSIAGGLLTGLGLGFALWAYRSLGSAFTPYPRPQPGAPVVETGPYRLVRHPIYGGALLLFAGISLAFSYASLAPTIALAVLWREKSVTEERFLSERFPGYADYRGRTRRRFFPYLY
jgi:protein-S-isoprenylcysteine O-methyltransferase Ste14